MWLCPFSDASRYTNKKVNQVFLIRKFNVEQLQSHICMRKGFLIYEEMRKYFFHILYIRRSLVIYDFETAPFSLFYIWGKFDFLFYQYTVSWKGRQRPNSWKSFSGPTSYNGPRNGWGGGGGGATTVRIVFTSYRSHPATPSPELNCDMYSAWDTPPVHLYILIHNGKDAELQIMPLNTAWSNFHRDDNKCFGIFLNLQY